MQANIGTSFIYKRFVLIKRAKYLHVIYIFKKVNLRFFSFYYRTNVNAINNTFADVGNECCLQRGVTFVDCLDIGSTHKSVVI